MPRTFADLGVPADITALLDKRGITSAFPVQEATLPDGLAGRDVCGRAPTGSGKTLAFGIPMVAAVGKADPKRPRGLVLVPTRELAAQVAKELTALAGARRLKVATFYGGTGYGIQCQTLRRGVDIAVCCPGRLEDLVARGDLRLDGVDLVVVDEADRMADMGFLPAVRRILDQTRSDRQTLLFSATLDGDVDVLIRRYQRDPVRHDIVVEDSDSSVVHHLFWRSAREERVTITADVVARHGTAVVFCRTRRGADRLTKQLVAAGIGAVPIHGSRSQSQREAALAAFSAGRAQALVATDVAARGIHVDDVACVVHFDPPADEKDYVHRSGRTGRAGADGIVVSLVGDDQVAEVRALQRALGLPERLGRPGEAPPNAGERPARVSVAAGSARSETRGERSSATGNGSRGRQQANGARSDGRRAGARAAGPRRAHEGADRAHANGARPAAVRSGGTDAARGEVRWFDAGRGFGFIAPDSGGRDVFVHKNQLRAGSVSLSEGQRVAFAVGAGVRGPEASDVRPA
ncbi:MAG: helicase, superfamily [Acidimicrobiaceae bacterium]|nr:helicase, superfamily [Acidimicrobiaceae bacterium]